LETVFPQERVNDKPTTSQIETTSYIHDEPQEIFVEDILSSALGKVGPTLCYFIEKYQEFQSKFKTIL
jgi:hypothetical protein